MLRFFLTINTTRPMAPKNRMTARDIMMMRTAVELSGSLCDGRIG